MTPALLGKKIGMTRVYDERGRATAVTVIDVSGNTKLQVKTPENDGYSALQVGFDTQKESRLPHAELGHFEKYGSEPKKFVAEFRLENGQTPGEDLNLTATLFKPGQLVDVIGQSKGKGFQGIMKKHNADGQGAIVSASRSILFAERDTKYAGLSWETAVERATQEMAGDITTTLP